MLIYDPVEFGKDLAKVCAYAGIALFLILMIWATLRPYFGNTVPGFPTGFQPPA